MENWSRSVDENGVSIEEYCDTASFMEAGETVDQISEEMWYRGFNDISPEAMQQVEM